jgi:hypothetical protein
LALWSTGVVSACCAAAGIAIEVASTISGIAVASLWHTTPGPNFFKIANMTI